MLTSALAGFGLGLSLIVAIGAQNLFVLRQGVRREHVLVVVAVCAVSDAVLIVLGVSGIGLVLQAVPWLIDVVRWAGALFLAGYGLLAARRAWRPAAQALEVSAADAPGGTARTTPDRFSGDVAARVAEPQESRGGDGREERLLRRSAQTASAATGTSLAAAIATCLALTWLNPHVYLDTVFLLGSVASTHGDARWLFAAGAVVASLVWFTALGFGARYLGRWLATPRSWRVLDGIIAVVMIGLAVSLVLPH